MYYCIITGSPRKASDILRQCFQRPAVMIFIILSTALLSSMHLLSEEYLQNAWNIQSRFVEQYVQSICHALQLSSAVGVALQSLRQRGFLQIPSSWESARSFLGLKRKCQLTKELACCPTCYSIYSMKDARQLGSCTFKEHPNHKFESMRRPCGTTMLLQADMKTPVVSQSFV